MEATRIVTDSTADLGPIASEYGITVVPLTVSFGDETFEDGVTIEAHTFFERLAHSHERPTTSQPTPGAFEQIYRQLLNEGASGIVSIHISSKLSGTFSTAMKTAEMLREMGVSVPIEVIDSQQGSLGMHFGILAAAQAAREGGDAAAAAVAARDALARTTLYLVADDLDYLQKGGRIGQAKRVLGTLLNVKPIISLLDGAVVALENPRTRKRAYERIAEYVREAAPVEGVIVGQSSQEVGDQLEEMVRQVYDGRIRRMWAGPTIGTHVGPGAAGLALLRAQR
ncbi:MAG: DegV family protein [Ktedonobacterales bacterium]